MSKKIILSLALLLGVYCMAVSQAKKPTIMVVPSDAWCITNGYMQEFDNQGQKIKLSDYRAALSGSPDLLLAISKINELMAERGFPLKNLESSMKTIQNESAEDAMLTSKGGSDLSESPIDQLKKVTKADIWMQLTWSVNQVGPKKSVTFNLQGIDAYTDKQIAGASGTGQPSFSAEVPVLLEEGILAHLDNFNTQLQAYFEDLLTNGREIVVRVKKWDSFDGDLESEYDGKELNIIIEEWMAANTVQGRFSTSDATENMMLFEQARIPLFNTDNRAIDARAWARGLQKMLKTQYQIESKLVMKGLGQVTLVIGEK